VLSQPRVDPSAPKCVGEQPFQHLIQAPNQRFLRVAPASMDGDHVVTIGQECQTSPFIKSVTRQMERPEVARRAYALEKIEIQVGARNTTRDFRRTGFDTTTVGRNNCDR